MQNGINNSYIAATDPINTSSISTTQNAYATTGSGINTTLQSEKGYMQNKRPLKVA